VPDFGIREVIPTTRFPNFRDHGKMVDRPLLRVLSSLQKGHCAAWASEASLRRMICEDTGHAPGVGTLPKALARLHRQGIVIALWLKPGGLMPDGSPCTYGTRWVELPHNRHAARAFRARSRREQAISNRPSREDRLSVEQARAKIAQAIEKLPDTRADFERMRRDALEALEALRSSGFEDAPRPKPPP